jgi:methionyl-tRNA formyltransferase
MPMADSERARIVFFGTPPFAVPSLRACVAVGTVVTVVTQPDRPRGRGQHVTAPAVKEEAERAGLTVLQPPRLKGTDFAERLRALRLDVAVVAAYGRILPPEVLAAPRLGCLNVHASLLPRWRGAAPIQWALASGDSETGVCLMQMEAGLDTGPVLAVRRTPILSTDTSETLHHRLAELGGELVRDELPRFLGGALTPRPQPEEGVTIARLVEKEDGRLDWTRPAMELERRIRAFVPWPGGWTALGPQLLKIWRAEAVEGSGPPGTVLAAHGTLDVACGEGALRLLEVQPAGRRRMTAAEFLSGHRLREDDRPFGGGVP